MALRVEGIEVSEQAVLTRAVSLSAVIASAAKQSIAPHTGGPWIASLRSQ